MPKLTVSSSLKKRNFLQTKEDQKTRRAIIAKFASEVFKDKDNDPLGTYQNAINALESGGAPYHTTAF